MLGIGGFGPVKRDFYGLLCMRRAPKKEALYEELRALVTRMNRELPGIERKCAHPCSARAPSPGARAV